jgi:hypothetical protein
MGKWLGPPHAEIRRYGAKTRYGNPCGRYSMANGRCCLHGGKSTIGARNPRVKHGMYTKAAIEERRCVNELIKEANRVASEIIV